MYCLSRKGLRLPEKKQKANHYVRNRFVDGQREDKAGSTFDEKQEIIVKGKNFKICQSRWIKA